MVIKTGLSERKFLFVDDNKTIQNIVKKIAAESQFRLEVLSALTGEDAIQILHDNNTIPKPSMILLDLNLPAMNGHDVLKRIKNDENYKDTPVIILTASDDIEELDALRSNGAEECYTKPFDFYLFNTLVDKIITTWASGEPQSTIKV